MSTTRITHIVAIELDAENAIQVLTVFENFISLGYLKQVIIVTHKKELKELKNVNYIQL